LRELSEWDWRGSLGVADLGATPRDLLARLGGPSLIRVAGRDPGRLRAVATLLHGNEPSGLVALHRWLAGDPEPAVDVLLFVGAVETALAPPGFAHRFLAGAIDFNRCWLPPHPGVEGERARQVLERLRARPPECLVDLHNNTGRTPSYGVSPRLGRPERNLVGLFTGRVIHMPLGLGTLCEATAGDWPTVTVECGRSGDPQADAVAFAGLTRLTSLERLELEAPPPPLEVIVDAVRVCVRPGVALEFGDGPGLSPGLTISHEIERHNFQPLPAGSCIGWVEPDCGWPLEALAADARDHSSDLFAIHEGRLETKVAMVPTMMTTSRAAALADCLFYAGQPAPDDGPASP